MCANGPGYSLDSQDISKLLKEGKIDCSNGEEGIDGRLVLTNSDPNLVIYQNGIGGLIDIFSPMGVRIRRFPDSIHPDDYEGTSLFVLRVSKSLFGEIIEDSDRRYSEGSENRRQLCGRCKYDRFLLSLDFD